MQTRQMAREIVDVPLVKEEVEDGELWGCGGYILRGEPDFDENPEPKRRKVTSVVETNNYITKEGLQAEVKDEAESFPFVVEHAVSLEYGQIYGSLPIAEKESDDRSFNVHDLFSNEAAAKEEEEGEESQNADERQSCPVDGCLEKFPSVTDLAKHMKFPPKPVVCGFCKKSFPKQACLRRHYATHTGEKNFECHLCDYKTAMYFNLKTHLRIHTKEKPYTCSFCGKTFGCSSTLTKHVRTHTGEAPFPCSSCDKRFKSSSDLTRHTRTHTGETPFPCISCDKRFKSSGDLIKHNRTHTGEKPFGCSFCDKRFTRPSGWRNHLRTHMDTI